MRTIKRLLVGIITAFFSLVMQAQTKDLVQYVNTLQGTDSHFGLSYEL